MASMDLSEGWTRSIARDRRQLSIKRALLRRWLFDAGPSARRARSCGRRSRQQAANSDLCEAAGAGWSQGGLDGAKGVWMAPGELHSTGSLTLPPHIGVQKGHFRYGELIFVPSSSTLLARSPRGGVAAGKSGQKLLAGCCFVVACSGYGFSISCRVMVSR